MTDLDRWLQVATRRLSANSVSQVRTEIREHYESSREAAVNEGASADEADRLAVLALGDARTANCHYRKVLLTRAEARMLRESQWEAQAVCSTRLKWLFRAIPLAALIAAVAFFFTGANTVAWLLLVAAIGIGFLFAAPLLPIYTPSRGRFFRYLKWAVVLGILGLAFGPDAFKWSWLLFSCLWPMAWIELRRNSIRRKLPVSEWPRHLYL